MALGDEDIKRLMTLPGVDMVVAVGLMAAIGRIDRFDDPDKLVAYLGLNPSVRQSGDGPAHHGRITKRGRSNARHLLVEAAWQAARSPGPLRVFHERVRARRGNHVAAVAVARKLALIAWHILRKGEDYEWVRPALMARKRRNLELLAGLPKRRGQRGAACEYNHPERRRADRARAERGASAYRHLTDRWRPQGPRASRTDISAA